MVLIVFCNRYFSLSEKREENDDSHHAHSQIRLSHCQQNISNKYIHLDDNLGAIDQL